MAHIRPEEICKVLHDGKWSYARCRKMTAKTIKVTLGKAASTQKSSIVTLPLSKAWKLKRPCSRRKTTRKEEVLPKKRMGPRPERFRVPAALAIETVSFERPGMHGDYAWHLKQLDKYYVRSLHAFNENAHQQMTKCTFNGAGNACVRSYRQEGRSIGIPTGDMGGWHRLDESTKWGMDAKGLIDLAFAEIVDHVAKHPTRFDRMFYCVNKEDVGTIRHDWIGNGVFRIGDQVRSYITQKIKALPKAVTDKIILDRIAVR